MFFESRSLRNIEETTEGFQISGLNHLQATMYQDVIQEIYDGEREIVYEIEEVLGSERIGKSFNDISYRLIIKFCDVLPKPTLTKFKKKLGFSSKPPSSGASSPIPVPERHRIRSRVRC